jgi:hypothetical protein
MADDTDIEQMTPEQIQSLMDERDRLMAERDNERRRADAESNRADSLQGEVNGASQQLSHATVAGLTAQESAAEQTIATINQEMVGYRKQLAELNSEGKFDEAAEVQEKMADAAARRREANQTKTYYASQREKATAAPADPVDRFLAQNSFTKPEQDWIREHPRYATDRGFNQRVNDAHNDAISKGLTRFSPEYFKHLADAGYMRQATPTPTPTPRPTAAAQTDQIDNDDPYSTAADLVDGGGDDQQPTPTPAPAPRQQARAPMAAPPSRRAPTTGNPARPTTRLTPDQAEAALAMSEYFPEDVQNGGDAAIYAYYAKLNTSPMANRKREEWAS